MEQKQILGVTIDYIPKIQARKIYTYAKEQLDFLKNPVVAGAPVQENVESIFEEDSRRGRS